MRIPNSWLGIASAAALVLGGALSAEAQEIKFWTLSFDNPNVGKAFEKIIKDFEAANPGVTVKLEPRVDRRAQVGSSRRERFRSGA